MRTLSSSPYWARAAFGGLVSAAPMLLLGILVLLFAEPWVVRLAYASVVAIVVVVGLQVYVGNAGGVNFSHTVFMAIGAYAAAILSTPMTMKAIVIPNAPFGLAGIAVNPALAALIGLGVVAIAALITGMLVVRLSGTAADILTLCLQIIAHGIFITWNDLFRGSQAFFGIPQVMSLPGALFVATIFIIIARVFRDSPAGVQLRASAENLMAARCFGVDVKRLRLFAWVLSAVICGAGGMLFAFFIGTISAKSFYFSYVFLTLAMLILGGMRTVSGAVVGVLIIEVGIELIRNLENGPTIFDFQLPTMFGLSGLMLGIVIVACMVFRPAGIMGTRELDEWIFASRKQKKDDQK